MLLLDIVPPELRRLSYREIRFCIACVKKVCRLWAQTHFDIFRLLIVLALWSQPVLRVGKQVADVRSEIIAARRVVKLRVALLQQCSSASSYVRRHFVMDQHYTGRQHSRSFFFRMALRSIFLCFAINFRRYCGSLLHELHHQRFFPFPEKSFNQLSGRQTTFV
jgi:hypothetical protein